MAVGDTYYRADTYLKESPCEILRKLDSKIEFVITKFKVVKETPCYVWLVDELQFAFREREQQLEVAFKCKKGARRTWCYPTVEKALQSLKKRKEFELKHLNRRKYRAEQTLEELNKKFKEVEKSLTNEAYGLNFL